MSQIQLAGTAKQHILLAIEVALYKDQNEYYESLFAEIAKENQRVQARKPSAFKYRGNVYSIHSLSLDGVSHIRTSSAGTLHKDLWAKMDQLLRERDDMLNNEWEYVKHFLVSMLNQSKNVADLDLLMPDSCKDDYKSITAKWSKTEPLISMDFVQRNSEEKRRVDDMIKERKMLNLLLK